MSFELPKVTYSDNRITYGGVMYDTRVKPDLVAVDEYRFMIKNYCVLQTNCSTPEKASAIAAYLNIGMGTFKRATVLINRLKNMAINNNKWIDAYYLNIPHFILYKHAKCVNSTKANKISRSERDIEWKRKKWCNIIKTSDFYPGNPKYNKY